MRPRTPLFIVTSTRPRVGKTLMARGLVEYFCALSREVEAFDVNPGEFSLLDHLPGYTAAASLDDIRGEMALFDQLATEDGVARVVDLGERTFDRFFTVLRQIDLSRELRRRDIAPVVLYIADPDERAVRGYATLLERCPDVPVVPVLNEVTPHIGRHADQFEADDLIGLTLTVPALTPVVRSVVDRKGFSLIDYIARTRDSTSELYQWTARLFMAFRDIEARATRDEEPTPQLRHTA